MKKEAITEDQFLWKDEKSIKQEKSNMVTASLNLNRFVKEARSVLGGKLSEEQMIKLKDEKFNYLEKEVKKLFQFPNASDEFNLNALGISIEPLRKYNRVYWKGYEYDIIDEEFVLKEDQPILERYYAYADNTQKKEMLRIANTIVEAFRDARTIGMVRKDYLANVCVALNGLVVIEGDSRGIGDCELLVNKKGIGLFKPTIRQNFLEK
ncbi:hypothetical protein [Mesoflavibacter zeaxanthinifaciens]|uniref:hypothetical protein n=1 Tax=Mesoflavibacter zeaxanthinifaciens TaxID=393060 RepID=UPI0004051ACE|nr:hypothetical protein [Mesoflavibacter zeaxanthinifaciens]